MKKKVFEVIEEGVMAFSEMGKLTGGDCGGLYSCQPLDYPCVNAYYQCVPEYSYWPCTLKTCANWSITIPCPEGYADTLKPM